MTPRGHFTHGPIGAHMLRLCSTTALSLMALFAVDILTLAYVAMLHDPVLLAAVGIGKTLVFINSSLTSGLVVACGALLSARAGRHTAANRARLVTHMLVMIFALSSVIAVIELALAWPVATWLGADPAALQAGSLFIGLVVPATVFNSAMQLCAQLLRAEGHSRLGMGVVLTGALVLAVADPVLIFGAGLGLDGAAITYALAAVVACSAGVHGVATRIGLAPGVSLRLLKVHTRRVIRLGLPAMLGNLATPFSISYLLLTLAGFGAPVLAAMAVIDRLLQFGYCLYFALPSALAPVLAQNLGAGCDGRAQAALAFTRRLVILYGLAVWAGLALAAPVLINLFGLPPGAWPLLRLFCQVGAGLWIAFGLDFVALSMFLTMGRPWWVAAFAWLRGTLGTVPFVYLGGRYYSSNGALLGMWLGNALVATLAIITATVMAKAFFARRALPVSHC
jgi:Na+-driven multidrug efflux pump